jgi:ferredoxin
MGTGACAYALPGLFTIGDDGKAKVIGTVEEDDKTVADVVGECPTAALRLVRGQVSFHQVLNRYYSRRDGPVAYWSGGTGS